MSAQEMNRPFRLGGWRVEPSSGRLTRIGAGSYGSNGPAEVTLRPKVMELLVYLVSRAGEVVSNDDLITHVWKGVHVTEASLYYSINQLRTALGDHKEKPEYIETLAKRGYRLVAGVEYEQVDTKAARALELRTRLHHAALVFVAGVGFLFVFLALPGGRGPDQETGPSKSIAVLPFAAAGPDEDDGYLADGLTEEFINSLSKIRDLSVMGRTSSFYYKNKDRTPQQIGRELGVDHLLEGSVQRDGERLRITAQLVDATSGATLWSESYDGTLADIFSMQTEVASQVTRALSVTLLAEEADALKHYGTQNAEARSLYLIALARLRLVPSQMEAGVGLGTENLRAARDLLAKAVAMDTGFAEGWAALSRAYWIASANLGDESGEIMNRQQAYPLAQATLDRALALAPDLVEVRFAENFHLWNQAKYISRSPAEWDRAVAGFEALLADAPDNVEILEIYAAILIASRELDRAIALQDRALALDPLSKSRVDRAQALRWVGKYESARTEFRRIGEIYPDSPWQAWIAAIEYDMGHFHHAILWSDSAPASIARLNSWASMGKAETAVESLDVFRVQGGETNEFMDIFAYKFRQDNAGLREWLMTKLKSPDTATSERVLRYYLFWTALCLRDWPAALADSEGIISDYPDLEARIAAMPAKQKPAFNSPATFKNALMGAYLAYTLDMNEQAERAAVAWEWAEENLKQLSPRNPFGAMQLQRLHGLFAAGRGDKEAALTAHERLYELGWRHLVGGNALIGVGVGWLEDPLLDSIRDEPRFIAVMDKIKADNAAMLAELKAGLTLDDIMDETFEDYPQRQAARGGN